MTVRRFMVKCRRSDPTSMRPCHQLLIAALALPLTGQRHLLDGLPADTRCELPRALCGGDEVLLVSPVDDEPHGLAWTGKVLWLACGDELWRLSWPELTVQEHIEAPPGVVDLCADTRSVYALCHDELLVLDAISGRPVHRVPLDLPAMAEAVTQPGRRPVALRPQGVALLRGALHVLASGHLFVVDRATGSFEHLGVYRADPGIAAQWLTHDGTHWIVGGEESIARIVPAEDTPDTPAPWSSKWSAKITTSSASWVQGELVVFARAPGVDGFPQTTARRFAPRIGTPPTLLRVGFTGQDYWILGSRRGRNLDELQRELRAQFEQATTLAKERGEVRPPQLLLLPLPQTQAAALARAWDRALAAGFTDVRCPGLEPWAKARASAAKTADK